MLAILRGTEICFLVVISGLAAKFAGDDIDNRVKINNKLFMFGVKSAFILELYMWLHWYLYTSNLIETNSHNNEEKMSCRGL